MPRPAISRLFDHTVRIWRAVKTQDRLGVESRDYAPVGEEEAFLNRPVTPAAAVAGGLAPVGRQRLYLNPNVDVQLRDIVQVTLGRNAGRSWEVDEPPVRMMGHHTQVDCIAWHGTLTESDS